MTDKHAQFDGSVPANYDRYLGPVLFEPFAVDLAARLVVAASARVLELACGTGILTRAVRAAIPASARMVATDLNEPMLRFARDELGDRVSWAAADASALPFAPETFDAVVCQFGLMFVPDKIGALEQVRRVLRPGGAFCFNVWDTIETNELAHIAHATVTRLFPVDPPKFYEVPFNLARKDDVAAMLDEAGFGKVTFEVVRKVGECATAHEAALGLVYGNPIITAIRERGTVDAATVVEAIEAAVEDRCATAPTRAKMQALVVTARPD